MLKAAWKSITNDKNENYSDGERLVRELTATDEEEPDLHRMKELVYVMADQPQHYQKTYTMLMKRVTDYRYSKHMEKGLHVVEYLLKNGDERFVKSCKTHLSHFQKLKGYKYEMYGKDYGIEVRKRANRVVHFLTHDKDLEAAREEALGRPSQKNKEKTKTTDKDEHTTADSDTKSDEKAKKESHEHDKHGKETEKNKKDEDHWLNEFTPEEHTGNNEDGGKYTFGDFDKYEEPFDEK